MNHCSPPVSENVNQLSVDSDEYHKVIYDWNNTHTEYPQDLNIPGLVAMQAENNPHQKALIFANESLTYADLNRRANQLAHQLIAKGTRAEMPVGICMERSLATIIAILAIFKSGGVYLPLDPDYPELRLAQMIADSSLKIVITNSQHFAKLPQDIELIDILNLPLDDDLSQKHNPMINLKPDHAAYMLFTSGSTGRPKLTINTHRGLFNRIWWMKETFVIDKNDKILHKTPYTFDVSIWEIFWPLVMGSTLVIAIPHGHKNPLYLSSLIEHHQISNTHFIPSMLELFLQLANTKQCGSLKRVFCSGEALTRKLSAHFFSLLTADLYNLYGPTECGIEVTCYKCEPHDDGERPLLPIGHPIANNRIYILNSCLQPVPPGQIGELYIAGAQVGRGYHGRAELTREKFIADPFTEIPNSWMYRSGDLASWSDTGEIEYHGRVDQQIKIRGMRIELGEIEAVLLTHPDIDQALISTFNNDDRETSLVAYVICKSGVFPSQFDLSSFLQQHLPENMVPLYYVNLKQFSLNINGKIDRNSLPLPGQPVRADYVPPVNQWEQQLISIWSEVLHLEKIGTEDNFFMLGGHSFNAARLIHRIQEQFQLQLPITIIHEFPTVSAMARQIENRCNNVSTHAGLSWEKILEEIECLSPEATRLALTHIEE